MIKLTATFSTLLLLSSLWTAHAPITLSEFGDGLALNHTASKGGPLKLHISSTDQESFKGVFLWDNQSLFGEAVACGTKTKATEEYIDIQFYGHFDCSGVGGWPENTASDFEATARYSLVSNSIYGSYVIVGAGRLPRQRGEFHIQLGGNPFYLGLMAEFPCEDPEEVGTPMP